MRRAPLAAAFLGPCLLMGACAATRDDGEGAARVSAAPARPADFTLAVTVRGSPPARPARSGGGASTTRPASPPPGLRPARYVIEADGVLRAALGPGATDDTFPVATRRLDPADLDRLWAIVARAGWLDSEPRGSDGGVPAGDASAAGATIAVSGHGARRTVHASRGDASGRALTEALAGLAWQAP